MNEYKILLDLAQNSLCLVYVFTLFIPKLSKKGGYITLFFILNTSYLYQIMRNYIRNVIVLTKFLKIFNIFFLRFAMFSFSDLEKKMGAKFVFF